MSQVVSGGLIAYYLTAKHLKTGAVQTMIGVRLAAGDGVRVGLLVFSSVKHGQNLSIPSEMEPFQGRDSELPEFRLQE